MNYITIQRAKFLGITGSVNIPYGSLIYCEKGYLFTSDAVVCSDHSQNAYDYFARNDDGNGLERGKLTQIIIKTLAKRNKGYQARWDKIWEDELCQKYKRKEYADYWLWNHEFYNAPIEDLQYIAKLVGVTYRVHCNKLSEE